MSALFLLAAGKLCLSLPLALVAWAVDRTRRWPLLAHGLWLLVLAQLLCPPLVDLPLLPGPAALAPIKAAPLGPLAFDAPPLPTASAGPSALQLAAWSLAGLWALGSLVVLVRSAWRILRFHRLLLDASRPAPPALQELCARLARRLGLRRAPRVFLGAAPLGPLLWAVGRPRIVLSARLAEELAPAELRLILAHELAHLRRRDHLVRWLEWLVGAAFWWNPVVWWARRRLRANEELCCDALVLSVFDPVPKRYAGALLRVAEILAGPALRPPALASGITSGGILERRLRMIISARPRARSRWLSPTLWLLALFLLPLGIAHAQSPDYEAVENRLLEAVKNGELSAEQAANMMGELARSRFAERAAGLDERRSTHRHAIMEHYSRLGLHADALHRLHAHLTELGMSATQIEGAHGAVLRMVHGLREGHELDGGIERYLHGELGLDAVQRKALLELAKKLAHSSRQKENPANEAMHKLFKELLDRGLDEATAKEAAGAVKRLTHAMLEAGVDDYTLDPETRAWLEELGLGEESIALVLRYATHFALMHEKQRREKERPTGDDELHARLLAVLVDAGIAKEHAQTVLDVTRKMAHAGDDDKAALTSWLRDELGLDDAQLELVRGLATRLGGGSR